MRYMHISHRTQKPMPSGRLIRLQENPSRSVRFPCQGVEYLNTTWIRLREVFSGPFRIIYHIKADQIDVLAVIHGAMNVLLLRDEQE